MSHWTSWKAARSGWLKGVFLFTTENGESQLNKSPCIFSVMKTNQMAEIKYSRKKQIGGARAKMIPTLEEKVLARFFSIVIEMWLVGNTIQRRRSLLVRERVNTIHMCADTLNKQCTNVERWLVGWAIERCRRVRPSINQKSWEPPRANFLQHTAAFRSRNVFLQITMIKPKRNHQYTFLPR